VGVDFASGGSPEGAVQMALKAAGIAADAAP
jgi:hypothetical protein